MVNKLLSPKDRVYLDPFQMGFVWLIINGIDSITTYPIPGMVLQVGGPVVHLLELHGVVGRAMHLRNFWVFTKNRGTPIVGW